ncbi:MAG: TIM barrel protein [Planctomycetes bacterium]|nr:TIM barrel protein [Planctomycetota bacterium]
MIKGMSYWSMKDGLANTHSIADALDQARAHGFGALELCIGATGVITPSTSEANCLAIRSLCESSGLVVETLASGMSWGVNPISNDPAVREKAIELHAAALQRAAWLGCEAMLFVPGVVVSPIASKEKVRYDHALTRCRHAVARLLEAAEKVHVDLCLENVWNGLFYSPIEFAQFIDSFASDRLGAYFDAGNLMGVHQHPPHWIELLGSRIKRVHIKDFKNEFGWQGRYTFCGIGEGDVPWAETFSALRAVGYDGTVIAEVLPWNDKLLATTSAAMDRLPVQWTKYTAPATVTGATFRKSTPAPQ